MKPTREAETGRAARLRYFFSPPTCSVAAMIALEATGAPYEAVTVDLVGDRSDYFALNPTGKVPALLADGTLVTETPAIIYWLAKAYPEAGLLPAADEDMAQALSMMGWLSSALHITRRQYARPSRFCADLAVQAALKAAAADKYWRELTQLDTWISEGRLDLSRYGLGPAAHALLFYHWATSDQLPVQRLVHYAKLTNQMMLRADVERSLRLHASPLLAATG